MNSSFEQELQDSLARRAETGVTPSGLDLATVKGRARRIERRRRGVVAGVAAAVAAVVVPTSLALAPSFDRSDEVPPAPQPTFSPAPTPEHALPGGADLDFRDLPVGPDPAIGYLDLSGEEPVVREPGGNETVLELENPTPFGYTDLEDGRYAVLTRDDEGVWYVEVTDSAGTTRQVHENTGGFTVDESHAQVAWANPDREVVVLVSGEEEPRVLGEVPGTGRLTITDLNGAECFRPTEPAGDYGCVVHVESEDEQGRLGIFTMTMDDLALEAEQVTQENHADSFRSGDRQAMEGVDWTARRTGLGQDGVPCSEVVGDGPDELETRVQLTTCSHVFDSFSPDGRLLLGQGAEGDSWPTAVAVYDMGTGDVRWERRATDELMGRVPYAVWEDEEHLLAPAFQGGRWQLVRFSADGAVERVTGQVLGDEVEAPFLPEAQHSAP